MSSHNLTALAVNEYFANNAPPEIARSQFDRSAGNKLDFDAGELIPFYADGMIQETLSKPNFTTLHA